jgi:hypothetical protein
MFGAFCCFLGAAAGRGPGEAVGRTAIGRFAAFALFGPVPSRGPGEAAAPLGAGFGAVPAVCATAAVLVGLGLGTPLTGAVLARATAAGLGDAFGITGAGVAGLALGEAVGAGGCGDGCWTGTAEGEGDGAAVGGAFTATATGATVGTLIGAAGTSLDGFVSKMFCVGSGLG